MPGANVVTETEEHRQRARAAATVAGLERVGVLPPMPHETEAVIGYPQRAAGGIRSARN